MEAKDLDAVTDLLKRYLSRFDMAPVYNKDEIEHLMLHKKNQGEQVIWSYVVEVGISYSRMNEAKKNRTHLLRKSPTSSHSIASNPQL
jgi:hypothetical protein